MQIIYKIIMLLLIIAILFNMCSNVIVYAIEKEKITIQSIGEIKKHLKILDEKTNEKIYYETEIAGYITNNGNKYPIYDLNKQEKNLNEEPYYAYIDEIVENKQVEKIIKNGYLCTKLEEWDLENEEDLYVITQIAIECILGNIKIESICAENEDKEAVKMYEGLKKLIQLGLSESSEGEEKVEDEKYEVHLGHKLKDSAEMFILTPKGVQKGKEEAKEESNTIIEEDKESNEQENKEDTQENNEEENKEKEKEKEKEEDNKEKKDNIEKKENEKEELKEIKGQIKIVLKSKDENFITKEKKGTIIGGAKFEIYNEKNEKLSLFITDEKGIALTSMLNKGKYTVKQISTKKGYYIENDIYNAEIKEDKQIVEINIKNESINPNIKIEEIGIDKAEIGKEIEYDISLKNSGNTEVINFIFQDDIPANYINVMKFNTGSYNQDIKYDIYYKSNMSSEEYILLMEDLNSKENYEIDFSAELADNEYLSGIKIDFGKVDAGFCSNENPHINALIKNELKSETTFNNITTLTAQFDEYKMKEVSKWKTFAYKLLPKTGV